MHGGREPTVCGVPTAAVCGVPTVCGVRCAVCRPWRCVCADGVRCGGELAHEACTVYHRPG